MAYMSQENKAKLAIEIAKVMPSNWKHTLAVRHHSTLVLTVRQADVDLIAENLVIQARGYDATCRSLNVYHLNGEYSGKLLKIFEAIKGAMMIGNHDRSDSQADIFDVGWYIDINIGDNDSPFRYVKYNPTRNMDALKQTMRDADRPKGMPEGLDEDGQMEWMKIRIAQLEGKGVYHYTCCDAYGTPDTNHKCDRAPLRFTDDRMS